jgi:hypothetical protein
MKEGNFNFADVIMGFACPMDMARQIVEESRRLYQTKSGIIRRALLYYFQNKQNNIGGAK